MPRRRPKKPRVSRMDAAVDAMAPFGFPVDKVMKHVRKLLEVYGGDDGWPFIEEYSYKELIDAMLRDVNEEEEEENQGAAGNTIRDEGPGNNYPEIIAEPKCPEFASSSSRTNYGDNSVRQNEDDPKLHLPSKLKPANSRPPHRRMHCYGWIGSDDEKDADDFLVLKSAYAVLGPKPDVTPCDGDNTRGKRRSRWDLKPGDP